MTPYFGITYPNMSKKRVDAWKRNFCVKNMHLFDEVWSLDSWHLVCDACNLSVEIKNIDTKYVDKKTLKKIEKNERRCR